MTSKWAEMRSTDQPAWEFARDVILARANVVTTRLPLAAHHYQEDVEHVHQLRVGCRRTTAALRAFEPLVAEKPKALKKWLKRIRKAAGPARDLDVLLERFSQEPADDPVVEYALARLGRERKEAQAKLVQVAGKASRGTFVQSVETCAGLFATDAGQAPVLQVGQFARFALRLASTPFLQLAQVVDPTIPELHQLRIAGKRLRYSIEIFHDAFPAELREKIYPLVSSVQSHLGRINDRATAQALFQQWLAVLPASELASHLALRIAREYAELVQLRGEFLDWWSEKRLSKIETALQQFTGGA